MSLTLLDFILFGIMLVSGLLALMRGFTREVLSLVAWLAAAVATYFVLRDGRLAAWAMANLPYLENDKVAMIATGAAVFLLVLIVMSVISVKISDYVIDSAAGAFDRTLGLVYGLARGLVFIAIIYLFYGMWLVPADKHEPWVKNAMTLPLIKATGDTLFGLLPANVQSALLESAWAGNAESAGGTAPPDSVSGYQQNQTQGLDTLIQGSETTQQPVTGQSNPQ